MKARHSKWLFVLGLCLAAGSFGACGDDDSSSDGVGGSGGSGGKSGAGGRSGSGGTAGKAGTGGKGGSGGAGATVTCGSKTCTVNATLKSINAAAQACCTADTQCGQYNSALTCLPLAAPGPADTSCPGISVTVASINMTVTEAGCCTPKGQCGGDFSTVGWGCVPREDVGTDMGGPLEHMSCGDTDGGADAGN